MRRAAVVLVAASSLAACTPGGGGDDWQEAAFWARVEELRVEFGGDAELMAGELYAQAVHARDGSLLAYQRQLVAASARLYTWRHLDAAEMVCGFVSDDVFTDWRSWVITLGRDTFERVAADPDALADVEDLSGGCEAGGEFFGAAVSVAHGERHGFAAGFPVLEPVDPPTGERLPNADQVRAVLPRLAARIPDDGLGAPPRGFLEQD